ncbi:taurine dioxygenase [Trichosporon asahii var. asahii CBS 2479]|uniref:Taurine dioxygenase n=1 Tax=Trichosporon asahii var. asahii (strain ATCC 90039 / CBS 2479 / JCM 2466 / KCTC 7840 / NBRC 103889/ NCYC 2677 / UAMH 7654) TaxID=1186058 RepID=J5TLQ8_TRIAS|nr:taurine dioxygenase [Trichosporon asahii var. asahii CBS 2479]EJT51501.1 taurine dioxygenase [Trichosporon asahii var. asahii CBS 2479]
MAPVAVESQVLPTTIESLKDGISSVTVTESRSSSPEAPEFDLKAYSSFDNTPSIGTEFREFAKDGKPVLDIRTVLADDTKLAALGRLVSERGVVFFRNAQITPEEQLTLVDKLGKFGGKPDTSRLHVHPCTQEGQEEQEEITIVSNKYVFGRSFKRNDNDILSRRPGAKEWHSDITFEPVPSDYASLVIRKLPEVGGDTLWASAYEAYDRLSPSYQRLLEGLSALHKGDGFIYLAKLAGLPLREGRGAPENVGQDLEAIHPVVRTNPVTGWKGLFVNQNFTKHLLDTESGKRLPEAESEAILTYLFALVEGNHDLQVRFRWEKDSLAIWDNRSTFHAATSDIDGGLREGTRSVSLGERPYFDPKSLTRRQALKKAAEDQ